MKDRVLAFHARAPKSRLVTSDHGDEGKPIRVRAPLHVRALFGVVRGLRHGAKAVASGVRRPGPVLRSPLWIARGMQHAVTEAGVAAFDWWQGKLKMSLVFFATTYHMSKLTRSLRSAIPPAKILPIYAQFLKKPKPLLLVVINWRLIKAMMSEVSRYIMAPPAARASFVQGHHLVLFSAWLAVLQLCDELYSEAEVVCPEGRWLASMKDVLEGNRRMVWYGGQRTIATLSCILPTPEPYATSEEEFKSHLLTRHSLRADVKGVRHRNLYGVRMWVLGQFDGLEAIRHLRLLMNDVISSTGLMLTIEGDEQRVCGRVAVGAHARDVGPHYFCVERLEVPELAAGGPLEIYLGDNHHADQNIGMSRIERDMLTQACRTVQSYVRQASGEVNGGTANNNNRRQANEDFNLRALLEAVYKGEVCSRLCSRTPAMLLSFAEPDVVVLVSHRGAIEQAYVLTVFERISWDTSACVIRGGRNAIAHVPL